MTTRTHNLAPLLATAIASLLMVACSSTPTKPEAASGARQKLTQLQANPQLASRAPVAIKEAEAAVRAAETPSKDVVLTAHRVFIAERKVDTAVALAQSRMLVDHRKVLSDERDNMRLQARTNEANRAHADAEMARSQTDQAQMVADQARLQNAALKQQIAELQQSIAPFNVTADLGPVAAESTLAFFESKAGHEVIERMHEFGIDPQSANYLPRPAEADTSELPLAGKTIVLTGTLSIGRDDMKALLEAKGAKVSGSISKNTDYLLAGEGGGSKRDKAEKLGVAILTEEQARALLD